MPLRLRFLLSLLTVLVLMAAPALYAANRVNALRDIVLDLRGEAARAGLAVSRLDAALVQLDRAQRVYVATADGDLAERMHGAVSDAATEIDVLRSAGYGDLVDDADLRLDQLHQTSRALTTLVEHGLLEQATAHLLSMSTPAVDRSRVAVLGLATAIDVRNSAGVPVAQRSAVAAGTATTVAVLVALALAAMLALAAAGVLTRPLDRLRFAMARVAEGTFEVPPDLPYDRADEIGHLARSFRTMTVRLAELDRMKAEFVGTVSHDLKTPVSVISGYTELMQEELTGSLHVRHRELLGSLADQTRTLQRRIDQLLDISRMESGRLRLGLEEIGVSHFMHEVQRAFIPVARAQGVKLELSVHDSTPPFLIADPDVLRADVLDNLISNAIKFTPAGGTVHMSVRPDGDRLVLEVADTGSGIPHDQIDHIFEKYFQGRGAKGGAGLGLAIARAGVEAHGGRIEVQSRVGRGSRLRVTLPLHAVTGVAPEPAVIG